jgi:hypothetical protein
MVEPRIDFGPSGMKTLPSTFVGSWQSTPEGARIVLTKTYRFDGPPSEYTGVYDAASRTVTGKWDIHGYTGAFKLEGLALQ